MQEDKITRLKAIAELRDSSILDEREFQEQKAAIMSDKSPYIGSKTDAKNEDQTNLVSASFFCAGLALIIFPFFLAPMGIVLGIMASSKGDSRGFIAALCNVVTLVIGMTLMMSYMSSF